MVIMLNSSEHFSEPQIRDYSLLTQDIIQILSQIVNKPDIKDIIYSLVWVPKIIYHEIIIEIFEKKHFLVIREEWIDYNVNLMYANSVPRIIKKIIKMCNHLILDLIPILILIQIMFSLLILEIIIHNRIQMFNRLIQEYLTFNINKLENIIRILYKTQIIYN